jgi:peptidoglycan/LPS O-acetylase OafA/YrhL
LRGIAALAVVLTHIPREHTGSIDGTFLTFLPMDFGTLGVPLFLVISGFCIHLAVARRARESQKATVDWVAFWKRRFYRLYPPYVAAIGFSLTAYFVVSSLGRLRPGRVIESLWIDLGSHLLLIQNLLPAFSDGLFNPAFWTLALEEQLYALFAVLLILRRRLSIFSVLAIAFAVEVIWRSGATWTEFLLVRNGVPRAEQFIAIGSLPAIGGWAAWPFAWWFLWVLGAVAAEGYAKTTPLPSWCYSRLLAIGMAMFGALTYFRTLGRYTEFWLTDAGAQGFLRAILTLRLGFLRWPSAYRVSSCSTAGFERSNKALLRNGG